MRRTTCGHWVHAICALWTPGTWITCETGLVEGLSKLPKVCCPEGAVLAQACSNCHFAAKSRHNTQKDKGCSWGSNVSVA